LFWGLGYLADEIVTLVLTNKWIESAIIIQVLCWFLPFKLLSEINGIVLNSKGRSDLLLKNSVISAVVLLISIYTFTAFDIKGLAFAWCVSISISFFILFWDIKSVLKFTSYVMLKMYIPQMFSTLIMLAGLYILNHTTALNGVLFLSVNILVGGVVYLVSVYLIDKPIYEEIQSLLRKG